jgi:hypothetical protein
MGVEEGPEQAGMELGVEDGYSEPFGGEVVGVGGGCTCDEAVKSEAAQVTGPPF